MSKIQAVFNGTGRQLRDAERPSMDAFIARYQGALTTPPGMARAAPVPAPAEKPKPRRFLIGRNVEVVSLPEEKKGRGKMTGTRIKLAKTLRMRSSKKVPPKVSGF